MQKKKEERIEFAFRFMKFFSSRSENCKRDLGEQAEYGGSHSFPLFCMFVFVIFMCV